MGRPGRWAVLGACILSLSGCGYRFAGRGTLPADIQTVAIRVVENRTPETGLDAVMTSALTEEFVRSGRVALSGGERADAILTGAIVSYSVSPVFYTPDGRIRRYRVTMTVDAELTRSGGDRLWAAAGFTENEDYDAGPEILPLKGREREAAVKIARDLAEDIHDRIYEDF